MLLCFLTLPPVLTDLIPTRFNSVLVNVYLSFFTSECGEIGPLKDTSFTASTAIQKARFARLNTSNPGESKVAWCRDPEDVDGFLQIDLGMRC